MKFQNSWDKEHPTTFQRERGGQVTKTGVTVASDFSIRCTGSQETKEQSKFFRKLISTLEFYIQPDYQLSRKIG